MLSREYQKYSFLLFMNQLLTIKNRFFAIFCLSLAILLTISSVVFCLPAAAILRQHHESPGVLRYHAQDSLKDKQQNTWQVVLFTDHKNSPTTKYYLRLVGFPGLAEFIHPQPLEIITSQGKTLTAPDTYSISAPAANVGQYDVTTIIPQLPDTGTLKLVTILKSDRDLSLTITKSILAEWQLLSDLPDVRLSAERGASAR